MDARARSGTWAKFAQNSGVRLAFIPSVDILIIFLQWLFTTGLSISAVLDVMIAGVLIVYLKKSRTGWSQ